VLQFAHLGGAAANTSSHGSESSSRCSAQQEKQSVNIEELGDSSEEPKRHQRINWSEEENDRLFSAWTKHSTDPVIGNDRKFEYYWKVLLLSSMTMRQKIATRGQSNN